MALKKTRKRFGFVIYSYFKDSAFTAVKRDAKFLSRYMKGVTFPSKMVYEGIRGWTTQKKQGNNSKGTAFLLQGALQMTKGLDLGAEPTRKISPWDLRQPLAIETPYEMIVYKSHSRK